MSNANGDQPQQDVPRFRRVFSTPVVITLSLLLGIVISIGSWLLRSADPWWSSMLTNLAFAAFLLVPGELTLNWVTSRVERVEHVSETARLSADAALGAADRAERSLEDVREMLISRQHDEHEAHLDVYRKVGRDMSRASLIDALRQATEAELITADGVRVPVWDTDLHYRFVLDGPDGELEVQLESDDGTVVSSHRWQPSLSVAEFFQVLINAVRSAGRDLGVGLNDPTQSVEDLVSMLVEVAKHRAQEQMGYRDSLHKIIERVDGWYFTERAVVPADNLRYDIAISRLNDMDWEEHLRGKGWYGATSALHFARTLYGLGRPPADRELADDVSE